MYAEVKIVVLKKFSKVYLFFCLCGNESKLDKSIKQMYIDEKNELLREDFMKMFESIKELYTSG